MKKKSLKHLNLLPWHLATAGVNNFTQIFFNHTLHIKFSKIGLVCQSSVRPVAPRSIFGCQSMSAGRHLRKNRLPKCRRTDDSQKTVCRWSGNHQWLLDGIFNGWINWSYRHPAQKKELTLLDGHSYNCSAKGKTRSLSAKTPVDELRTVARRILCFPLRFY